jgi:PAS domain S-box-containing protein
MSDGYREPPAGSARGTGGHADAPRRGLDPAWFERAVEAAGHAIFITDFHGRIIYVNPAFEAVTGYDATDAVGRTPDILNSGHHHADYFHRLWQTITRGDVWQEEIVNCRADGDVYIANQTIAPIGDVEDGSVTHFVAIQTDITERKRHEMALERSQDLSARTEETANVGGWELDLEAAELRWTAGTCRIHGVDPDYDPTLDEALSFYHPDDRDKIRTFVERALKWDLPYDAEARIVTADGATRIVRTTGQPVAGDGTPIIRGAIQDITERKARRQQLMVFNRVLRHNLRNGLNVVLGHAEGIEGTLASVSVDDDDAAAALERIAEDTRRIASAAEDLLDTSERARMFDRIYEQIRDVEPVGIRPLLESVATEYRDVHPEATVRVEGASPVVLANRHAVRVAVDELVDNAFRHSTDDHPMVTMRVTEGPDGTIQLGVADRGEGIPEMEREVIADGEERPLKHGSGLGLWIVKWLVTPIGGSLEIEDNEPTGAAVSIVFPPSRWAPSTSDESV